MNNTKEYVKFLETVSQGIEEKYAGAVSVEITSTVKNNGVVMQGIMLKEEGESVAPNFYLEQIFEDWKNGTRTMEDICNGVCNSYEEEKKKNRGLLSAINFCWEEFRENVYIRLVNRDRNKDQLEELPYREFLDMAMVYYYSITLSNEILGTIMIRKEHLELLHITEDELHAAAVKNTRVFSPARFTPMKDILRELSMKLGFSLETVNDGKMYVLSNMSHMFGAVSMVFEEELKQFSDKIDSSFYILPSSIHEVILVPEQDYFDPDYFSFMVQDINKTHVHVTEVLSDSVYFFDRNTMTVRRIR